MRVFYVAYVKDAGLRTMIDAMRLLTNPTVKWSAHVTPRGPYEELRDYSFLDAKLRGKWIHVDDHGGFFSQGQNTVYLKCKSPLFSEMWDKPDYGFEPHLTIYDGSSQQIAASLMALLATKRISFDFVTNGLEPLVSGDGRRGLCPNCVLEDPEVESVFGRRLDQDQLVHLDFSTRFLLMARTWDHLVGEYMGKNLSIASVL